MALNTLNTLADAPQPITLEQFLNPQVTDGRSMLVTTRRKWLERETQIYRRQLGIDQRQEVPFADLYDNYVNGHIFDFNRAQGAFLQTRRAPLAKANPPMEILLTISERDVHPATQINLFLGDVYRRMTYDLGFGDELEAVYPGNRDTIPGISYAPVFQANTFIGEGYSLLATPDRDMRIDETGEAWAPTIRRVFIQGVPFSNYHLGLSLRGV